MTEKVFDTSNFQHQVISVPQRTGVQYPWRNGVFVIEQEGGHFQLRPAYYALYLRLTCSMDAPAISRVFGIPERNVVVGKIDRVVKKLWGEDAKVASFIGKPFSFPADGLDPGGPGGVLPENGNPELAAAPQDEPPRFQFKTLLGPSRPISRREEAELKASIGRDPDSPHMGGRAVGSAGRKRPLLG